MTFKQPRPALIADMDAEEHAHHRKDLQPAFYLQSIRSFEQHMSKHVLGLKETLHAKTLSITCKSWKSG